MQLFPPLQGFLSAQFNPEYLEPHHKKVKLMTQQYTNHEQPGSLGINLATDDGVCLVLSLDLHMKQN